MRKQPTSAPATPGPSGRSSCTWESPDTSGPSGLSGNCTPPSAPKKARKAEAKESSSAMQPSQNTPKPKKRKRASEEDVQLNTMIHEITVEARRNQEEIRLVRERMATQRSDIEPDDLYIAIGKKVKRMSTSTQRWMETKLLQIYTEANQMEERAQMQAQMPPHMPPPLYNQERRSMWDMDILSNAMNLVDQ